MSTPIVNGQGGATEVSNVRRYSAANGFQRIQTWECTSADSAEAKYAELVVTGAEVEWMDGPKPKVVATWGADPDKSEVPQDSWELTANKVAKDLLDADHPLVNALNSDNVDEFRRFIQDPTAWVEQGGFTEVEGDTDSLDAADELWRLWQAGMRHISIYQPVLRLNRYVSRDFADAWEWDRVGQLYTTESMKEDSLVPITFQIDLDQITAQYTPPERADGIAVVYAWLKGAPTCTLSAGNKTHIAQEYEFGLWPVSIYQDPV